MSMITLKGIIDEDFVNYRVPSMTLEFPTCDFKCDVDECGICQNSPLVHEPDVHVEIRDICKRYINNPITSAIVCQGLEPFDSFAELLELIKILRTEFECFDDIVIYTGYNPSEIVDELIYCSEYKNIVVKFGRFIPNQEKHYDEVLGVFLASDNQRGERIS